MNQTRQTAVSATRKVRTTIPATPKPPPTVLSQAELKQVAGGVKSLSTQTPVKGW